MRIVPFGGLWLAAWFAAAVVLTAVSAFSQVPSSTWVQLNPPRKPSVRAACVMVYDPVSQKTVLFGGFTRRRYLNDTRAFDGTHWERSKTAVETPAASAAS